MAKVAYDNCAGLAYVSVSFAIFVVTLSLTFLYYRVEVWAVVSIMIGIAFAGLFARLTLFLSYLQNKPSDLFKPIVNGLGVFGVIGVMFGLVLIPIYNEPFPNQMCYEVVTGVNSSHSEEILDRCKDYLDSVQRLLDGVLVVFPIVMVFGFAVSMMYGASRVTCSEQADKG